MDYTKVTGDLVETFKENVGVFTDPDRIAKILGNTLKIVIILIIAKMAIKFSAIVIDKFFENSLNLSETSRQLFIHRNTLVYRLDKIQKVMGLDLRNFHDAVTFKIMMMLMDRYIREC